MIASFHDFHFLRPWWLLALAALPLLWRALSRSGADAGAWRGVVDAHLLPHLLDSQDAARSSRVRWADAAEAEMRARATRAERNAI